MTIGNTLTLAGVMVALFGPYIWKTYGDQQQKCALMSTTYHLLGDLLRDLRKINESNDTNRPIKTGHGDEPGIWLETTKISEVGHYFLYFEGYILPKIHLLNAEDQERIILFFNRYKKNISKIKKSAELSHNTGQKYEGNLYKTTFKKLITTLEEIVVDFRQKTQEPF